MKIINGRAIAQRIKNGIKKKVKSLKVRKPGLAIILIGRRSDSKLYVGLKEKFARETGIKTYLHKFSEKAKETDIVQAIKSFNHNDKIDAILVQLPLPAIFNADKIIRAIDPKKDVDGFHQKNLRELINNCENKKIMPPVFEAILEILKETRYQLKGKRAIIVSNSDIFGKSLKKMLQCRKIIAKKIDSKNKFLKNEIEKADILISVVGKPRFIKGTWLKEKAIVIDVGITKKGKKIFGDVDFATTQKKVGFITPVPGGVGPVTVAMLFRNTIKLYERK